MSFAGSWLVCLVLAAATVRAQEPAAPVQEPVGPITTLKLGTSLVGVSAVVLDDRSEPVKGLMKDDFVLKQDGKEQAIRYFSEDASLPLTLALMVDTSGSQRAFIGDETDASEKFFRVMMAGRQDRAMLVQFDTDVLQLQKMTDQVQTLENSLRFLSIPHAASPYARGGTLMYDAIVAAAQAVSGVDRGRRALVLLTDGDDHGSRYSLEQAVAAAQRADTVVYSVFYSMQSMGNGRMFANANGGGRAALDKLSIATGGRVFIVGGKMPLDLIFMQIADDMRLQYQIGYTPPESKPGEYHKIELKAKVKHVTVEARQGYYSQK